jgi:hypothetical protein
MGTGHYLNEQYSLVISRKTILLQKTLRNLMPLEMHIISEK